MLRQTLPVVPTSRQNGRFNRYSIRFGNSGCYRDAAGWKTSKIIPCHRISRIDETPQAANRVVGGVGNRGVLLIALWVGSYWWTLLELMEPSDSNFAMIDISRGKAIA